VSDDDYETQMPGGCWVVLNVVIVALIIFANLGQAIVCCEGDTIDP
jgi:hypothetical protein